MTLLHAAHELEGTPGIESRAPVHAHEDSLPHAADTIDILAVPLVLAAIGHKSENLVLRLQDVGKHAGEVLIDFGIVDTRCNSDEVIFREVGILVFVESMDIEGIDLGIRIDDGIDEFLGIAMMLGRIQDDRSHTVPFTYGHIHALLRAPQSIVPKGRIDATDASGGRSRTHS